MYAGRTSRQLRRMKISEPPKKRWEKSTAGYSAAISSRPFEAEELSSLRLKIELAVDMVIKGEASKEHWDAMAELLNEAAVRSEQIEGGKDQLLPTITAAMSALNRAKDRMKAGKSFLLDGEGLKVLPQAIAIYDEILLNSSPKQMMDAAQEVQRRMATGKTHQGR